MVSANKHDAEDTDHPNLVLSNGAGDALGSRESNVGLVLGRSGTQAPPISADDDKPRMSINPLVAPVPQEQDVPASDQSPRLGKKNTGIFNFSDEDVARIQAAFFEISMGDDWLSYTKTKDLWQVVFPNVPIGEVSFLAEKIFNDLDCDNSGSVSWVELEEYLRNGGPSADDEVLMELPRPVTWRSWMWALLEQPYSENFQWKPLKRASWAMTLFIQVVTVASIANMINESLPEYQNLDGTSGTPATLKLESFCITMFTLEFGLRMVCIPVRKKTAEHHMVPTQRHLWMTIWPWIDFLAIAPFYLEKISSMMGHSEKGADSVMVLRILRLLRLARAFRVMKLGRHSRWIQLMMLSFMQARLAIIWMCILLGMGSCLAAAFIYYAERYDATYDFAAQKWKRVNESLLHDRGQDIPFQSIATSMWWAIVTLTTVGYGDMYPVTDGGKALASCTMLAGILIVSYPVTVLTNAFSEANFEFQNQQDKARRMKQISAEQIAREDQPQAAGDDVQNAYDEHRMPMGRDTIQSTKGAGGSSAKGGRRGSREDDDALIRRLESCEATVDLLHELHKQAKSDVARMSADITASFAALRCELLDAIKRASDAAAQPPGPLPGAHPSTADYRFPPPAPAPPPQQPQLMPPPGMHAMYGSGQLSMHGSMAHAAMYGQPTPPPPQFAHHQQQHHHHQHHHHHHHHHQQQQHYHHHHHQHLHHHHHQHHHHQQQQHHHHQQQHHHHHQQHHQHHHQHHHHQHHQHHHHHAQSHGGQAPPDAAAAGGGAPPGGLASIPNDRASLTDYVRERMRALDPSLAQELETRLQQLEGRSDEITLLRDFAAKLDEKIEYQAQRRARRHQRSHSMPVSRKPAS